VKFKPFWEDKKLLLVRINISGRLQKLILEIEENGFFKRIY